MCIAHVWLLVGLSCCWKCWWISLSMPKPQKTSSMVGYSPNIHNILFLDEFFTPNSLFYVRNHLPVPLLSQVIFDWFFYWFWLIDLIGGGWQIFHHHLIWQLPPLHWIHFCIIEGVERSFISPYHLIHHPSDLIFPFISSHLMLVDSVGETGGQKWGRGKGSRWEEMGEQETWIGWWDRWRDPCGEKEPSPMPSYHS